MKTEKLYTEELSVLSWRFWDLAIQKVIRNFTSMKFILFNEVYIFTIWAVVNKLITGTQFTTIVVSGLTVIVGARVYADTRLDFDKEQADEDGIDKRSNKRYFNKVKNDSLDRYQEDLYDDLYK